MNMLAETSTRVESHTSPQIRKRIALETANRLKDIGSDRAAIHTRLRELDQEWDIERAIEANASTLVVAGSALALTVHPRFAWLPAVVGAFLLQHAIQGWCPPHTNPAAYGVPHGRRNRQRAAGVD